MSESTTAGRTGLVVMLGTIILLQATNTPYLLNKGWLIIILVVSFSLAAYAIITGLSEKSGLATMLGIITILVAFNTPYLMDSGWLIILLIIPFDVAAYTFIKGNETEN